MASVNMAAAATPTAALQGWLREQNVDEVDCFEKLCKAGYDSVGKLAALSPETLARDLTVVGLTLYTRSRICEAIGELGRTDPVPRVEPDAPAAAAVGDDQLVVFLATKARVGERASEYARLFLESQMDLPALLSRCECADFASSLKHIIPAAGPRVKLKKALVKEIQERNLRPEEPVAANASPQQRQDQQEQQQEEQGKEGEEEDAEPQPQPQSDPVQLMKKQLRQEQEKNQQLQEENRQLRALNQRLRDENATARANDGRLIHDHTSTSEYSGSEDDDSCVDLYPPEKTYPAASPSAGEELDNVGTAAFYHPDKVLEDHRQRRQVVGSSASEVAVAAAEEADLDLRVRV